jgi:hypothetical protein
MGHKSGVSGKARGIRLKVFTGYFFWLYTSGFTPYSLIRNALIEEITRNR